jgi:phosphate starvation-inducible membrane PsiE
MPDGILTIFLIILAIAIIWMVIKFVLKLTMRIFSCGCLLILVIGGLLFFFGYLDFIPIF